MPVKVCTLVVLVLLSASALNLMSALESSGKSARIVQMAEGSAEGINHLLMSRGEFRTVVPLAHWERSSSLEMHRMQVVARLDGHSHSAPLVRAVHLWNPEEAMEFTSDGLLSRDASVGRFIEVRSGSKIVLEAREIYVDGTMVLTHFLYHSKGR